MWVSKAKWATTIAKALMKGYFLGVEEERKKQLSSGRLVRELPRVPGSWTRPGPCSRRDRLS